MKKPSNAFTSKAHNIGNVLSKSTLTSQLFKEPSTPGLLERSKTTKVSNVQKSSAYSAGSNLSKLSNPSVNTQIKTADKNKITKESSNFYDVQFTIYVRQTVTAISEGVACGCLGIGCVEDDFSVKRMNIGLLGVLEVNIDKYVITDVFKVKKSLNKYPNKYPVYIVDFKAYGEQTVEAISEQAACNWIGVECLKYEPINKSVTDQFIIHEVLIYKKEITSVSLAFENRRFPPA